MKCSTCKYSHLSPDAFGNLARTCRWSPPTTRDGFPPVSDDAFCHEHTPRDGSEPEHELPAPAPASDSRSDLDDAPRAPGSVMKLRMPWEP